MSVIFLAFGAIAIAYHFKEISGKTAVICALVLAATLGVVVHFTYRSPDVVRAANEKQVDAWAKALHVEVIGKTCNQGRCDVQILNAAGQVSIERLVCDEDEPCAPAKKSASCFSFTVGKE